MRLGRLGICVVALIGLALFGSSSVAEAAPDEDAAIVNGEDVSQARRKIAEHVVGLERHLKQLQQSMRARIDGLEDGSTDERSRLEKELARAQRELGETVSRLKKSAEAHLELLEKDIEQARKRSKSATKETKSGER